MKTRGFEVAKGFENFDISLPERSTKNSAGYDFQSAEDIVIPSLFEVYKDYVKSHTKDKFANLIASTPVAPNTKVFKPTMVKTGIKAYMGNSEQLVMANRSSNPIKNQLILANGVGIVDSDYYNNPDNDGAIMFQFLNFGPEDVIIHKGDRIGQGIFMPYLKADDDNATGERLGGHGSTGK